MSFLIGFSYFYKWENTDFTGIKKQVVALDKQWIMGLVMSNMTFTFDTSPMAVKFRLLHLHYFIK